MGLSFSQRIGKKPIRTEFQLENIDDDLRTALWNTLHSTFLSIAEKETYHLNKCQFNGYYRAIWANFLKRPLDVIPESTFDFTRTIKTWFFTSEWHEVYSLIEFIAKYAPHRDVLEYKILFIKICNKFLESEVSGYRIVNDQVTPITDTTEIGEIEEAIANSTKSNLSGVHAHLKTALSKLSDRENPDYRNSIKESISAVESISKIISGNPKATLGEALKIIEDKVGLHKALKEGFSKIYGYTSDEGGIRHSMSEESNCNFEDAKYMLVSCSAFINYLIMKASKGGIEI